LPSRAYGGALRRRRVQRFRLNTWTHGLFGGLYCKKAGCAQLLGDTEPRRIRNGTPLLGFGKHAAAPCNAPDKEKNGKPLRAHGCSQSSLEKNNLGRLDVVLGSCDWARAIRRADTGFRQRADLKHNGRMKIEIKEIPMRRMRPCDQQKGRKANSKRRGCAARLVAL